MRLKRVAWTLLPLLAACSSGPEDPEPRRYTLELLSGDGQEAVVGQSLPEPLVYRLRDQDGAAAAGRRVRFVLVQGAGGFAPREADTDGDGRVATLLTLGTQAGPLQVLPEVPELGEALESVEPAAATALPDAPVALVWTAGDGQKDAREATLQVPLEVQAHDVHGNAVAGVAVQLQAAGGSQVAPTSLETAAEGGTPCLWTLGPVYGTYGLTATASGLEAATATAEADLPPSINGVMHAGAVDEGDPVELRGEHFCATPAYNTLTLGGVAMEVTEASETGLTGLVPPGLALGEHELVLRVGSQEAPEHFQVEVSLALGRVRDFPFSAGEVTVPVSAYGAGSEYAAIVYSLRDAVPYALQAVTLEEAPPAPAAPPAGFVLDFHRRLLETRGSGPPRLREREIVPRQTREFQVLSDFYGSNVDPDAYSTIDADLGHEGAQVLVYVDQRDLASLPGARLAELAQAFDATIYPTDRAAFGVESDFDDNGRVIVLLTRVVNELTGQIDDEPGWEGAYVGGFFNPVDLPIWSWPQGTSNGGEVFYGIVPDPGGQFSDAQHTLEETVAVLKPIMAHEFQHMINFHQRHWIYGGGGADVPFEELWLNEGLSHLAEQLCGWPADNVARVGLYLHGNRHRYSALASLAGSPPGQEVGNALGERGASFLFVQYLADRWPGSPMDLVKSVIPGRANVERATGEPFEQVFKDWLAALYLDGRDYAGDPRYEFSSLDIRHDFPVSDFVDEPLAVPMRPLSAPSWSSSMVPVSFDLLGLEGPAPGGVAQLRFGGDPGAQMGVLLIRTGL